jgi:hypothetical protein
LPEPQLISRPLIEQPRFNLELLLAVVLMIAAAGLFGWIIMTQLPDMLPQIAQSSRPASASAPAAVPERQTAEAMPGGGADGEEPADAGADSAGEEADGAAGDAKDATPKKTPRSTARPTTSDSESGRSSDGERGRESGGSDSSGSDVADGSDAAPVSRATTPPRGSTSVAPMPTSSRRASPTPAGLELVVEASGDTWIRVYTDGEEAYANYLYEGESMTWQATESVRLRTGNAGGTEITINGQRIDKLGGGGSVEEREWRLMPNGDIEQREV